MILLDTFKTKHGSLSAIVDGLDCCSLICLKRNMFKTKKACVSNALSRIQGYATFRDLILQDNSSLTLLDHNRKAYIINKWEAQIMDFPTNSISSTDPKIARQIALYDDDGQCLRWDGI